METKSSTRNKSIQSGARQCLRRDDAQRVNHLSQKFTMNKTKLALFAAGLSIFSASALAATNPCIPYATEANTAIAKALAADAVRTYNDTYFNRKGAFILKSDYSGQDYDFILKSYTLPAGLGKKMYYRFTDAVFKGTRNGTGAIVCSMQGEFSDGFIGFSSAQISRQ